MDSIVFMLQAAAGPAYYSILALAAVVGGLALISPRLFRIICENGSYWITTPLQINAFDKKVIDTDGFALEHCRLVGTIIIALAAAFAATLANIG